MVNLVMSTSNTWKRFNEPSVSGLLAYSAFFRFCSLNCSLSTMRMPFACRSPMLTFSAAGFIATSTSGASPGVKTSRLEKCSWKPLTPASVPAGARISAGKSGRVLRSLPASAVSLVKCCPASCMPSPESPANRMTTSSRSSIALAPLAPAPATAAVALSGSIVLGPRLSSAAPPLRNFPLGRRRTGQRQLSDISMHWGRFNGAFEPRMSRRRTSAEPAGLRWRAALPRGPFTAVRLNAEPVTTRSVLPGAAGAAPSNSVIDSHGIEPSGRSPNGGPRSRAAVIRGFVATPHPRRRRGAPPAAADAAYLPTGRLPANRVAGNVAADRPGTWAAWREGVRWRPPDETHACSPD